MFKPSQEKPRIFTRMDRSEERKSLRNHSTAAESTLWNYLKNRQIENLRFRRQHSIGMYVMDFYCPELKLCIELDGEVHHESWQNAADMIRTEYINNQGITVLRFDNQMVFYKVEAIVESIKGFKRDPKLRRGYIKNKIIGVSDEE